MPYERLYFLDENNELQSEIIGKIMKNFKGLSYGC